MHFGFPVVQFRKKVRQLADRDSHTYLKLVRISKRHIQWIGLSEAAHDILAFLLVESYWTGGSLSPEELSSLAGYSRGSISVAISQLRSLGFIESRIDTTQSGRGRRATLYATTEGLSGLILFGIRRLTLELEGFLGELEAMSVSLGENETKARSALDSLESEVNMNLIQLRKDARKMLSSKATRVLQAEEVRRD